ESQRQRIRIEKAVVRTGAVLEDRGQAGIGVDLELEHSLHVAGKLNLFRARIGFAGLERQTIVESAQVEAPGAAHFDKPKVVDPGAGGVARADVLNTPGDVELTSRAGGSDLRRGSGRVRDHLRRRQIRRGRQR